jgi:UDP-sugar transporter A1/2/3
MLSGLASACCQWALQVGGRDSFLFSAELGFFSICALFLTLGVELATGWPAGGDAQQMLTMGSVWASLDARTMVPILVNACGGVVVGLLTKFSGSVVKSYALIAGILLSTMLQMYFGGGGLTWQSKAAAPLVVVAMYLNFAFKAKKKGGAVASASAAVAGVPAAKKKKKKGL